MIGFSVFGSSNFLNIPELFETITEEAEWNQAMNL
jgi:hypothetical protein